MGKIRLTIPVTAGMKDLLFVIVVKMLKQCSSDARELLTRSVGAIGSLELDVSGSLDSKPLWIVALLMLVALLVFSF